MMVAVLVGVMWWDKPIDETLPPRAGGVATAPAPEAAPAETAPPPVVAPSPAPPGARANATADAAPYATAAKPASPAAAAERRAAADRAPPAEARKRASADMTARSEAKSEAPSAPQQPPPPPEKEAAAQPPAPTPAPFPAATPPATATAPARARDETAEPRAAAGTLAKSAPLGAAATQRLQADTRANVLGIPAERWSWRRDAEPHAMTAALQRWLAQLDGIARWQPASTAPPADAVTLRLAQDGTPHTTIAIGADAVWRLPAQGAALSAPLSPAAAATLKESLLAAAP
jgi:hypothetical protein